MTRRRRIALALQRRRMFAVDGWRSRHRARVCTHDTLAETIDRMNRLMWPDNPEKWTWVSAEFKRTWMPAELEP